MLTDAEAFLLGAKVMEGRRNLVLRDFDNMQDTDTFKGIVAVSEKWTDYGDSDIKVAHIRYSAEVIPYIWIKLQE